MLVGGPAEAAESYRARLSPYGDRLTVLDGQTRRASLSPIAPGRHVDPSRLACRENFSVQSKIAVYLAAGRPIVATDFGDYQQLLGATGGGLLTPVAAGPLADAIVRVLNDPALAASLAAGTGSSLRNILPWTAISIATSTCITTP